MKSSKRVAVLGSAALLSSGLFAVTASPAGACPRVAYYGVTSSPVRIGFSGVPHFKNGRGGEVTGTRSTNKSVSFQVTAGAESEVGAVLAKAKVSVSASLTKSQSTDVIISYRHKIPAGKFGHLKYVSYGKKIVWKKYLYDGACKQHVIGSGTINFPTNAEGWYYWTTNN